MLVHQH